MHGLFAHQQDSILKLFLERMSLNFGKKKLPWTDFVKIKREGEK
jgi:hypothetical protein